MVERARGEPRKETIGRGDLFYLHHPGSERVFSGYGLAVEPGRNDLLVGLLMVDRPYPADPAWLQGVQDAFGECQLVPMTAAGERGLVCQMHIDPDSTTHLRRFPSPLSMETQMALEPLLEEPPRPVLNLSWDDEASLWRSEFAASNELPPDLREVFERTGYGCLAAESDIGVVHVCHASDVDIAGFADKPVWYQWQLLEMPTAPLIRLDIVIVDDPAGPFKFESFLNIADESQAQVLATLANQEQLYLAFYGDELTYRYTKFTDHNQQQWQMLDEMAARAGAYWESLPDDQRDFDQAKAAFMQQFI